MSIKKLECEACGEIMNVDVSTEIGFCPFCGTKYDPDKIIYIEGENIDGNETDEESESKVVHQNEEIDMLETEVVPMTGLQENEKNMEKNDKPEIIDEEIINDSCYDSEKEEFFCPYCLSNDVRHERRYGILAFLFGWILAFLVFPIIYALHIEWLTDLYALWFVFGSIIEFVKMIINKMKPKWSWDMSCNKCNKKFIWDPTIKKIVSISGDRKQVSPEKEIVRKIRMTMGYLGDAAILLFCIWYALSQPKEISNSDNESSEMKQIYEEEMETESDNQAQGNDSKDDSFHFVSESDDQKTMGNQTDYDGDDKNITVQGAHQGKTFSEKETEGYADILADTGVDSEMCEYLYYDLDRDTFPEMLIGYGSCEADFQYSVYTTDNQGYISGCGTFPGSYLFYEANDGDGLYAVAGNKGIEHVYRVTLDEKREVVWEELWSKELSMYDDYFYNDYPVTAYSYENPYGDSAGSSLTMYDYIIPESDTRLITEEDISGMNADACKLARNEIYARHGRIFADEGLNNYFNAQTWYVGFLTADEFDDSVLSDIERKNLDTIVQYEKKQGYR